MAKICEMAGVREYADGYPVELILDDKSGRLCVSAWNQGGHDGIDIDLCDLIDWLTREGWLVDGMVNPAKAESPA